MYYSHTLYGLGLWCLTPHSTIFELNRGCQFYWWRKQDYRENTTDLPLVTNKLHHSLLYRVHLSRMGFQLTMLVVVVTDSICIANLTTIRSQRPPHCIQAYVVLRIKTKEIPHRQNRFIDWLLLNATSHIFSYIVERSSWFLM